MKKYRKNEIEKVAGEISSNSELFGDEFDAILSQLKELSNSANEFGCAIEGKVSDFWGGDVAVMALPDNPKECWSF